MTWIGSFKSLQSMLPELRFTDAPLEVRTWVRSEIGQISPLVDWLMNLIAASRCVRGEEQLDELGWKLVVLLVRRGGQLRYRAAAHALAQLAFAALASAGAAAFLPVQPQICAGARSRAQDRVGQRARGERTVERAKVPRLIHGGALAVADLVEGLVRICKR